MQTSDANEQAGIMGNTIGDPDTEGSETAAIENSDTTEWPSEQTVEEQDAPAETINISLRLKDASLNSSEGLLASRPRTPKLQMRWASIQTPSATHIRIRLSGNLFLVPHGGTTSPSKPPPVDANQRSKPLEPPVTLKQIDELSITTIMSNFNLRHDIHFQPELHYHANLCGDVGLAKTAKNDEFWARLLEELQEFTAGPHEFQAKHGQTWTLPTVLREIRDIIRTAHMEKAHIVSDGLDIPHMMQELSKGVADLEAMATWLAEFLCTCCAPMRDQAVKEMSETIIRGHRTNDLAIICDGIQALLCLAETLALDVANHKLRCMTPKMIAEGVAWERYHLEKKARLGKLKSAVPDAYNWFKHYESLALPDFPNFEYDGNMGVFFKGIVHNLAYPNPQLPVPDTLASDYGRVGYLRAGVLEAVNYEICKDILIELVPALKDFPPDPRPHKEGDHAEGEGEGERQHEEEEYEVVEDNERDDEGDGVGNETEEEEGEGEDRKGVEKERLLPREKYEVIELRRRIYHLLQQQEKDVEIVVPIHEMRTSKEQELSAWRRFFEQKWKHTAPLIAVEILRFSKLPSDMLPAIEAVLAHDLSNARSPRFVRCQKEIILELGELMGNRIDAWEDYSNWQLHWVAAKCDYPEGHKWCYKVDHKIGKHMWLRNIARVAVHVGLHHWRVWGTLGYSASSRFINPDQRDGETTMVEPARPPRGLRRTLSTDSLTSMSSTSDSDEDGYQPTPPSEADYQFLVEPAGQASQHLGTAGEEARGTILREDQGDDAAQSVSTGATITEILQTAEEQPDDDDNLNDQTPIIVMQLRPKAKRQDSVSAPEMDQSLDEDQVSPSC